MPTERVLSTAEARREAVVASAVVVFAQKGLAGTPIAAVAEHASISPAYVSKLFSTKVDLFVAALDACYARIVDALERGAASADDRSPEGILHAMGGAYADLIADRDLLMLQVHAQASTDVEPVAAAVRRGIAAVTSCATARSGAPAVEVQRFVAFGQLCHLLTTVGAFDIDDPWAHVLTTGIRHTPATSGLGPPD